jgi:hypothetical protein
MTMVVLNLVSTPSPPFPFLNRISDDQCADLQGMEFDEIIGKVYPLHENSAKKKIIDNFCKNRNPFTKVPIDDIRRYFGEEVAFYFAWLGNPSFLFKLYFDLLLLLLAFYTRWLGFASIIGIIASIAGYLLRFQFFSFPPHFILCLVGLVKIMEKTTGPTQFIQYSLVSGVSKKRGNKRKKMCTNKLHSYVVFGILEAGKKRTCLSMEHVRL